MNPLFKKVKRTAMLRIINCLLLAITVATTVNAQGVQVNLAPVDGIELTPENIFNYQLQSSLTAAVNATVKGKVVYRGSGLSFSYSFPYTVRPGINTIDRATIHPQWTFSTPALKELFMDYKKLPAGTYEYCVEVAIKGNNGETTEGGANRECLYHKVDEVFLINLIDPENKAKLHEYYPVFTWMVNYPFAAALTYKLRVSEIKDGQNTTAAINRNNPVYQEKNIAQTSLSYPVYAKPLEAWQPYAWTVDAYYKGILLGGAEPWQFTIIEDSILKAIPRDQSHIDLKREHALNTFYAVGSLKLKYVLDDLKTDLLQLNLTDDNDKTVKLKTKELNAVYGDNRYELQFAGELGLKHMKLYKLNITNQAGEKFTVQFKYVNPDFLPNP